MDDNIREQTRTRIENEYNLSLAPIGETGSIDKIPSELNNCFIAEFEIDEDDAWDLASDLAEKRGVLDVMPDLETGIIDDEYEPPQCVEAIKHVPGWNHKKTYFKEAEEYSKAQGRTVGGEGIRIAHLDTGFTDHPEIDSMLKDEGYDVWGRDVDPRDELLTGFLRNPSHGTSIASVIIGSNKNIPDVGDIGVSPQVDLIPIRISPSVVHIFTSTILFGVLRSLERNVDVITMSMGGAPPRQSWRIAAREAYEKGVIWVTAAGNKVGWVVWPAQYLETIAVAATDHRDKPWKDSSRGEKVDISAPGHEVYVGYVNQQKHNCYKNGSGTSFATPHVGAAAAVWLAHHGDDLQIYDGQPWMRVEAFRHCLTKSATVPAKWNKKEYGAGILNVSQLLREKLPKPSKLKARRTPTPMSQTQAETINMVSKEIYYLTWSAEQRDAMDNLDYVVFKMSKKARKRVLIVLEKENTKNKTDKEKMDILKNAFLIGI